MKRIILALAACSLALVACAPLNVGIDPVKAAEAVNRAEARYLQVKSIADIVVPYLPAKLQVKIKAAEGVIETALVAARLATTAAEQKAALDKVAAQTDAIEAVTVTPD